MGSVRMGYGHHRIAYSALTWALELGGKPFLLVPFFCEGGNVKRLRRGGFKCEECFLCDLYIDLAWVLNCILIFR